MLKKIVYLSTITFVLVACSSNTNSQVEASDEQTESAITENTTSSKEAGLPIASFIPKGYEILNETKGKLNSDNFDDVVLVLKKTNEDDLYNNDGESSKRLLLILTCVDGNGYEKIAESENAIFTLGDGGAMGDPFSAISIKDGFFTIENMGGAAERWTRFITFENENGHVFLRKDVSEGFDAMNPNKVTYSHTKTTADFGQVSLEEFNISE